MRSVNIDKLNFVARALDKAQEDAREMSNKMNDYSKNLRSLRKSFNMSKGALKAWQESYAYNYEKRIKSLQDENNSLKEQIDKLERP